ncbi:MAG: SDR family NAD(P)-dependent oxidoreductase [Candidatus Wukongarchaeota archaeon]|nr:glucose 1-dehydrogenase [Candidatus Wukongarchaeota archaeon]
MCEMFDLTGKVAIVTGASRGLGRGMAIGLAKAGANVVVTDILDTKETVDEVKKLGREALGIKVNVTKKSDVEAMVQQTLEKFGMVDILVNNAGILRIEPTEDMKEEDWDKVLAINLKGQFLCAREVGKHMIKQKSGKIINMSSIAGKFGNPQSAAYNASKAGVILLTKTLAIDWGKHNIQVNAICPGAFYTPMTEESFKDENLVQMIKTSVPLGRYGEPEDLVGTVIYLASEASNYVTGHALVVDGGWTAKI